MLRTSSSAGPGDVLSSRLPWGGMGPEAKRLAFRLLKLALGHKQGWARTRTAERFWQKLLIARYQPEAAGRLTPEQVGVGVPRGAESLVYRVRNWLQQAAPDHVLLQTSATPLIR